MTSWFRALVVGSVLASWAAGPLSVAEPAGDVGLRVMSFNVRYSAAADGRNAWPHRVDRCVGVIQRFDPALIGFQEVLADQYADLAHGLPGYAFSGVAREDGKRKGEWSLIAYRTDRFIPLAHGDFWLSEHPDDPGSKSWDAALPRICSWILLREKATNREILYANTHFDHQGAVAREQASRLLAEKLPALARGRPIVLTGDLNSSEDTSAYQVLVHPAAAGAYRWVDSYREVHPRRKPEEASFHGFKGIVTGSRIDFILHSFEFVATSSEIDRSGGSEGVWPSDHYAVTATLEWARK